MKFKIIRDRRLIEDNDFIGYNNENRAEKLEFEIPQELNDYAKTINFQTIDSSFFDILEDNTYILKNNITKYDRVRFYLEFKKQISEDKIELIKTSVFTLKFQDSFDVEKEISEEDIQILDKLILKVDDLEKRVKKLEENASEEGTGNTTNDYEKLNNLPKLNNIELRGNRNIVETELTNLEIEEILKL